MPDTLAPPISNSDLRKELVSLRRQLHQHPELGFQEHVTSAAVRGWLREQGFDVGPPLAGTGFAVEIVGAKPGPTVAYRADMDALPIQEATNKPYASQSPGVMHACGHDAHMTIACGVALLARERREEMSGTLRVFFQPNEESTPSGAPAMIADGVLENVTVMPVYDESGEKPQWPSRD